MDAAERLLWCDDETIPLTPKQFELLFYFVENAGNLATKSELLDAVWTDSYVEETTLARNVSWLRKKLKSWDADVIFIETVSKLGYRFTPEVTFSADFENSIIVEEQTVQHFRGEETITIDDADLIEKNDSGQFKAVEKNKIAVSQNVSQTSHRSLFVSSLLLFIIGLVAISILGFSLYQNKQTAAQNTVSDANAQIIIENITVDAAKEFVDTGIKVQSGDIVDLSVVGQYQHGTDKIWTFEGDKNTESSSEQTFPKAAPRSLVGWIGYETDQNNYFQVSKNKKVTAEKSGNLYFALNDLKNNLVEKSGEFVVSVKINRSVTIGNSLIKIGSIVHLQNRYPNAGGYLDAWGQVWSKPEFSIVPTETKFVSTHRKPDRDNGSGSWEIVSATGKRLNEPLMVGDKIHLKNRFPNAGYLDSCGWTKDMTVFKEHTDQTTAVFTTKSYDRDNGTGTWIIRSAVKPDGTPVEEGDSIALENVFILNENGETRKVGFLNVGSSVDTIPAFSDYDGSSLVFTQDQSNSPSIPDIWTITISKASLK